MVDRQHEHEGLLLAALAGLLPEQEPEAADKLRLRAAIVNKVRKPGTITTRKHEGEWRPLLPGIHVKTLRRDAAAGTETTLWRLQPGARVPAHPHSREEECLVLEGSIVQDGVEYFPGDYLLAENGSRHSPFESPRGALFLIRGELLPDAALLGTLIP